MKLLSFELTMPNVGSWNGKWTGESKKYFVVRKVNDDVANIIFKNDTLLQENFYYRFGDGWGANVCVEVVDFKEAQKRRRKSAGFAGYEWMIDSIIKHNEIICS